MELITRLYATLKLANQRQQQRVVSLVASNIIANPPNVFSIQPAIAETMSFVVQSKQRHTNNLIPKAIGASAKAREHSSLFLVIKVPVK